ncbi:MAG: rhodanese-like domain-containing protein [Deltaproteobacteria bacterium]|nr:MAG: rhodanese-like domain-containing protein [Deltaproteobacteria bacterium]
MSWLSKLFGGGPPAAPRIDGDTARSLLAAGAQLVDVRTPFEFRSGHLDGAVNIPVDQLPRRLDGLDRQRPVVLYCRTGSRSRRAAGILARAGYTDIHDLGPMSAF